MKIEKTIKWPIKCASDHKKNIYLLYNVFDGYICHSEKHSDKINHRLVLMETDTYQNVNSFLSCKLSFLGKEEIMKHILYD